MSRTNTINSKNGVARLKLTRTQDGMGTSVSIEMSEAVLGMDPDAARAMFQPIFESFAKQFGDMADAINYHD